MSGIEANILLSNYRVPSVLSAIANDDAEVVIEASYGRDPSELALDPTLDSRDRRMMALWGMEAFTNPEAISESVSYARDRGLFSNPFLAPMKQLNYRVLIWSGALPVISSLLDLPTNGTVLSRANTLTYRSADFLMSTAQAYRTGGFGNQHHVFSLVLDPGVTLFHTHPAILPGGAPPNGNSPGYWTGTNILPVSCQAGSINVSVYNLPKNPGFGRPALIRFTHLHVPLSQFDRHVIEGNRLFLERRGVFVAVTAGGALEQRGESEFVQQGDRTFWITEAGSASNESFDAFVERTGAAQVEQSAESVTYFSGGDRLTASGDRGCLVNDRDILLPYARHLSAYATVAGSNARREIRFEGHTLVLDFEGSLRLAQ